MGVFTFSELGDMKLMQQFWDCFEILFQNKSTTPILKRENKNNPPVYGNTGAFLLVNERAKDQPSLSDWLYEILSPAHVIAIRMERFIKLQNCITVTYSVCVFGGVAVLVNHRHMRSWAAIRSECCSFWNTSVMIFGPLFTEYTQKNSSELLSKCAVKNEVYCTI